MTESIDRDLALSHPFANGHYDRKNANLDFILGYESYKEWLENLPPADVRPVVRGKWIKLDMHKGMEQYKCSVCRSECYVPECMGEPIYAYCPNCGADMKSEKEDK